MTDAFTTAHAVTHRWEKGYSDHPRDPGGATQDGVTQRVYDAWRRKNGYPVQPVRKSTEKERLAIYRAQYWDAVKGENLPPGIDLAVYDFAVNSGVSRAIKYLQSALGVKLDGHIGQVTLRAAQDAFERGDAAVVAKKITDGRERFLRGLDTFDVFGKGWMNRLNDVRKEANKRVAGAASFKARPASDADSYAPAKSSASPPAPVETATKAIVAIGGAGTVIMTAATQVKNLFGEMIPGPWVAVAVVLTMTGAAVYAYLKARDAE